ncbi:MAG: protein kinase, partial [Myxococcales bacterium]|nr:protein kinase [Myxococcales bacterium]
AKCGAPLPVQRGEEADPMIGKTIGGRYRVTGVLGEGGMGRVYVGEQQMGTSVRKVAIKTLLSQYAKDPATVARFMREVGTVSELEHPNTIKVYDFGQIDESGELYIAMELLQGKTLEDVLMETRPLSPERVDRIIGQACGSLQEAHDKGIVHRDLKPANIFLTRRAKEDDVVKVLDFGIAKSGPEGAKTEEKLTQQGTLLGTPPYMSPEQFTGKNLDGRSDIYSLAVVTYEMLTGRLPFEADTPWQWMTQHGTAPPLAFEAVPEAHLVPPKMRDAVMRALSKKPEDRPQTARDFYEALTLGSMRMSAVGLGAGGILGMPTQPPMSSLPSSGSHISNHPVSSGANRPGGTQVGAPIDFGSTQPADGAFDYGASAAYGGPTKTAVGLDMMAGPHPGHVPTAGGQAFPLPPPTSSRSGGNGLMYALIGGFLIAAFAGAFYWRSTTAEKDEDSSASATETSKDKEKEKEGEQGSDQGSQAPSGTPTTPPAASETANPAPTETAPPTLPGRTPQPTDQEWAAATPLANVINAKRLGCEAKQVREWVRVECDEKTVTAGSPTSVSVTKGGDKGDTFTTSESARTSLIYPHYDGQDLEATFAF